MQRLGCLSDADIKRFMGKRRRRRRNTAVGARDAKTWLMWASAMTFAFTKIVRAREDNRKITERVNGSAHAYEVRPRKDHRGIDLISDALPLGRLWYDERDAIDYAKFRSRSHNTAIRVCDEAGNVARYTSPRAISKNHEALRMKQKAATR
jgi:hypothetical protein